jgi:hypothetical protein
LRVVLVKITVTDHLDSWIDAARAHGPARRSLKWLLGASMGGM